MTSNDFGTLLGYQLSFFFFLIKRQNFTNFKFKLNSHFLFTLVAKICFKF